MTKYRPGLALLLLALIGCDAGAGATQSSALAQAPKASSGPAIDACLTCHAGPMSFAGRDSAAVAQRLKEIVAGSRPHPPLQLVDTGAAALESLAERLTSTAP